MWNSEFEGATVYVTNTDTPGVRYEVVQDTCVSDPIVDSGAPVEHFVVRAGYTSSSDTPSGELSEVFARFNDEFDNALDVTRRYARIFMGYTEAEANERIALVSTSGHSQSDWTELFVHVSEGGTVRPKDGPMNGLSGHAATSSVCQCKHSFLAILAIVKNGKTVIHYGVSTLMMPKKPHNISRVSTCNTPR